MYHRLTEKARTSILLIALIRHDKRCKLKLRILSHLRLCDGQVERVSREDWVLDLSGNVSASFFTIAVQLECDEIVEFLRELEIVEGNL